MAKKTSKRKTIYLANKSAKVGSECTCPICGCGFIKRQYSQAFCCPACKDKFHNDRKKYNLDRSGYYQRYNMEHPERLERIGIHPMSDEELADWVHPFSEEGVQGF